MADRVAHAIVLASSSAAAIVASALLELSNSVPDASKQSMYWNAALLMLDSLSSPAYLDSTDTTPGLLLHGVGHLPTCPPASTQTPRVSSGVWTRCATMEGLRKMPEPMMPPMTSMTPEKSPTRREYPAWSSTTPRGPERVEHRLRQESWPKDHPLHLITRQLHDLDAQLHERVRQRLAFWEPDGEWSFMEGLVRLEARVREPLLQVPGEAEPVLLTGGAEWGWGSSLSFLSSMFWVVPARALGLGYYGYLASGALILVGYPLAMRLLRRRARFWLTPWRLVWRTSRGQVRQVLLDSGDGRRTHLVGMEKLQSLRGILTMRELPPLRGQTLGFPTYVLAMFLAVLRKGGGSGFMQRNHSPGMLVMRPGQLVFLEDKNFWNILREVFHRGFNDFQGLTLGMLLQQLQLLPEAEFDRCLEEIVRAREGSRWAYSSVTHGLTADDKYQVLLPDGSVLTGVPDATQHTAIFNVADVAIMLGAGLLILAGRRANNPGERQGDAS